MRSGIYRGRADRATRGRSRYCACAHGATHRTRGGFWSFRRRVCAAVTAGVLSLRDAVELVRLRAELMMKLYPSGYGLSAIVGLNESQVTKIVQAVTSVQDPVFVGNINAPRQIVIAGSNMAMDQVLEEARRQGANKAVRLHVSVPSHCPLLQPVADLLGKRMSSVKLTTPRMTYVGNVNARAMRTKEIIARDLVNNIAHAVRWYDATTILKELGCDLFLEMPPGHTLTDLAKQTPPGINSLPVEASVLSRVLRLAHQEEASTLEAARNSYRSAEWERRGFHC